MQDYEYKDEGGRFLCRLHHRMRCDECHYVSELRDENKRYRERVAQLINYIEMTDDETDRQVHKIHVILDGLLEGEE